jgi:hypothetical protein
MSRNKKVALASAVVLAAAALLASTVAYTRLTAPASTVHSVRTDPAPAMSGGASRRDRSGYTGAGWSLDPDTDKAVTEAVSRASLNDATGLTMLFYTPQHDAHRVAAALAHVLGGTRRSFGMTTHDGILTSDGYHSAETGVVGALAIDLTKVTVGIGAASFANESPGQAAKLALHTALADAKKGNGDRPSLLVVFCTVRTEEALLAAIAEEIGADVPLVGGTAAGLVSAMERKTAAVSSSMIVDGQVVENGVAVAVFYAPETFALAFGGGFARGSGKGGVVTSSKPRLIETIDGRPAVDVYDEWLGGRLSEARATGKNVQNFLAFYPLVQTVTNGNASHNQFVRAWPSDNPAAPGSLTTGADVHDGETVYTSEGSENILLNRFASLPRQARKNGGDKAATAGLFFYCAGALQTIPREHRGVLATLVQQSMGDIPWIGLFTWGEQGSVPGIGYQHGNLMASTVLFPSSP